MPDLRAFFTPIFYWSCGIVGWCLVCGDWEMWKHQTTHHPMIRVPYPWPAQKKTTPPA